MAPDDRHVAPLHYHNKTIVITGASSGIGRALALRFARDGARLVLAARRPQPLDDVTRLCREAGAEALAVPTDVAVPEDVRGLVTRSVEAFGTLDVLVNAAGVGMRAAFKDVTAETVIETLTRVNYLGAVYATRYALPHLIESRGQIVALASLSSFTGVPSLSLYAGSKHALLGFFESLRLELEAEGLGVGVTVVAPDFVATDHRAAALGPEGRGIARPQPWGRGAMTAEACADVIIEALRKRRALVITTRRGRLLRLGRLLAPRLVDRLVSRAIRRGE